ncbi:MAG TPA: M67 family metallopeptidase [Myxococcales bacterium]|jgi:proteasome lid subunit RPN8/RPN11|nr:M67 family metallopeptidase [Myxococcales bacterium]
MSDLGELPADLGPLLRHLEACYPNEGCGVVLRGAPGGPVRVRPMENAYDRYHAQDPEAFPRTSRTAYHLDPRELLAVFREADDRGEALACIFHSHADAGAYFSAMDRTLAAPDGEPLYPGVGYLVVAVDQGRATAARLYRFEAGDFREVEVPLGAGD